METDNGVATDYGISMFHQLHCLIILRRLVSPETSQSHGQLHLHQIPEKCVRILYTRPIALIIFRLTVVLIRTM
jgi:hypothetical protein